MKGISGPQNSITLTLNTYEAIAPEKQQFKYKEIPNHGVEQELSNSDSRISSPRLEEEAAGPKSLGPAAL